MHPLLKLSQLRPPEYHRGLAHGLQLALDQLRLLESGDRIVVTLSCIRALHRRLDAIGAAIRAKDWNRTDALLEHKITPPIPTSEPHVHVPWLGHTASEDAGPNHGPAQPAIQQLPHHSHRRSR